MGTVMGRLNGQYSWMAMSECYSWFPMVFIHSPRRTYTVTACEDRIEVATGDTWRTFDFDNTDAVAVAIFTYELCGDWTCNGGSRDLA